MAKFRNIGGVTTTKLPITGFPNVRPMGKFRGTARANTIPNLNSALFWLDGTINEAGTEFVDASGGGNNFKIYLETSTSVFEAGNDFPEGWTTGFPYKSAAIISAPSDFTELIDADTNNFWYGAGDVPNKIPVVSLFQNIDYEDTFFNRHVAQVVDGNGVETQEPYIIDIVAYNAALTGADLTTADSYYDVPTKDVAALWVAVGGTGVGTEVDPYGSIVTANTAASAGQKVYIKSGTYDFGGTYLTPKMIEGLGRVDFTNLPTNYAFSFTSGTIKRLMLENSAGSYPLYIGSGGEPVIENIYITGYDYVMNARPSLGTTYTIKNSVIVLPSSSNPTFLLYKDGCVVDTCYIEDDSTALFRGLSVSNNQIEVKNCKINSTSTQLIQIDNDCDYAIFKGNEFVDAGVLNIDSDFNNLTLQDNSGIIEYILADSGTAASLVTIERNVFSGSNASPMLRAVNVNHECHDNIFNTSGSGSMIYITAVAAVDVHISGNRFYSSGLSSQISIGYGVNLNTINGYYRDNIMIQTNAAANPHGIQNYNNKGFHMYRNKAIDVGLAFVYKGDSHDVSGAYCNYNNVVNGKILLKGVDNLLVYNNVVYNDAIGDRPCIEIIPNVTGTCDDNIIKNNIFQTALESGSEGVVYISAGPLGNVFDHNIDFIPTGSTFPIARLNTTNYDFAGWQALGNDLNGFNTDPLLTDEIPAAGSDAIGGGETLTGHATGLDITTDWGDDTVIPSVVTKEQTGSWDIGAYVI